ncbi:MAG: SH3 domain-containing protein [Rhizobiales bacterium]|nr:SH3 domain-containing protein [Hyphomicrobiales bacterium]
MAKNRAGNRRIGSVVLALACFAVAVATGWSLFGKRVDSQANVALAGSVSAGTLAAADSTGLPIPRFVSLKAEKVNVRRGPSSDHAVAWVFKRKGMPVEIVAEFENWRRVRDSDGEEGWILKNMLTGKRTAVVAPWRPGQALPLYSKASGGSALVAKVSAGVVSEVSSCTGEWCAITAGGYGGWIEQAMLWGVYPGEPVD